MGRSTKPSVEEGERQSGCMLRMRRTLTLGFIIVAHCPSFPSSGPWQEL